MLGICQDELPSPSEIYYQNCLWSKMSIFRVFSANKILNFASGPDFICFEVASAQK